MEIPPDAGSRVLPGRVIPALIMGGIGVLIEVGLLRRLYARGWPEQLLATYAIVLIVTDLVKWAWGGQFLSIPDPSPSQARSFSLWISISLLQLLYHPVGSGRCGVSLVAHLPDPPGRHYSSRSPRREMVSALGIPIPWLFTWIFVLGAMIAGFSGAVTAPFGSVAPGDGR